MECKTSQPCDQLRYYYEDGRGNRVWVQNLRLDYRTQHTNSGWNSSFNRASRCNKGCSVQQSHSVRDSMGCHKASGTKRFVGDDRRQLRGVRGHLITSSPIRRATTPPARCTCFCTIHSRLGSSAADVSRTPGDSLKWSAMPEESLKSLIHSVDDAEYILGELRQEEQWLRNSCRCL